MPAVIVYQAVAVNHQSLPVVSKFRTSAVAGNCHHVAPFLPLTIVTTTHTGYGGAETTF